jgi:hypothetical protein
MDTSRSLGPVRPLEFDVPKEATAGGYLRLRWYGEMGLGGNDRGCQVAEVWLVRLIGLKAINES